MLAPNGNHSRTSAPSHLPLHLQPRAGFEQWSHERRSAGYHLTKRLTQLSRLGLAVGKATSKATRGAPDGATVAQYLEAQKTQAAAAGSDRAPLRLQPLRHLEVSSTAPLSAAYSASGYVNA
jgi:hypothetical protein